MAYFEAFPRIYYNGRVAINLLTRSELVKEVITDFGAFYPFVLTGDVKAETVAERYYGSADRVWIVWFSNQVFDPYYTWPLTDREFNKFLEKKYGSIPTAMTTIHHYTYNATVDPNDVEAAYRSTYTMTPETWSFLSTQDKSYWSPVLAHEYEAELNHQKRNIRLLDNDYVPQIEAELKKIMSN